jgi:hypothetical protein
VRSFLVQHLVGRAGALPEAPAWHAAEVKVSTP